MNWTRIIMHVDWELLRMSIISIKAAFLMIDSKALVSDEGLDSTITIGVYTDDDGRQEGEWCEGERQGKITLYNIK